MSFYSSLIFCHAAPPPMVTGASLGAFVHRVAETAAVTGNHDMVCSLKFGSRIDRDELPAEVVEWDETGLIATYGVYEWDHTESYATLAAMAAALSGMPETVYRASLQLGRLDDKIVAALTREASPDNDRWLCLCDLSLEVGPILSSGLSEGPFFGGWMGLSFSGYGYFYPWTYKETRLRAEAVEGIDRLVEACRRTWPIQAVRPSPEAIAVRRQMGELWLYDDLTIPRGWLWVVAETG
jgi:hypothetical protein